jgi:hypothetical protein
MPGAPETTSRRTRIPTTKLTGTDRTRTEMCGPHPEADLRGPLAPA